MAILEKLLLDGHRTLSSVETFVDRLGYRRNFARWAPVSVNRARKIDD